MRKISFVFSLFALVVFSFGAAFAGIEHVDADTDFVSKVINSKGVVLVDFWAPWCGPCQRQGEILEALSIKEPSLRIVKVNVDNAEGSSRLYRIDSIPTLIIFKDGKQVDRWSGVRSAEAIMEKVNRYSK